MTFSICLDALYQTMPAPAAMAGVKECGLSHIEFWGWWDKDLSAIRREQERLQMHTAAFCTRFVSMVEPGCRPAYLEGLRESLEAARQLGCPALITQVGADSGSPRADQAEALLGCLRQCAPLLEDSGITLLVEPLNRLDHPGYFLTSSREAFALIREVNSPFIKVLFDIYHQQVTEGDVIRSIQNNIDCIGHFHAAGNPGRGELDTGELCYSRIFDAIAQTGYTGCIGLEYFPKDDPSAGLRRFTGSTGLQR